MPVTVEFLSMLICMRRYSPVTTELLTVYRHGLYNPMALHRQLHT